MSTPGFSKPPGNEPSRHGTPLARADFIQTPEFEKELERAVVLAFAPLHKRSFGVAVGSACALIVAAVTLIAILHAPQETGLGLLGAYFRGYDVSWAGLFIGAAWAGLAGFVAGWFMAFARNFVLASWILYFRVRANLAQTRDFLDHI